MLLENEIFKTDILSISIAPIWFKSIKNDEKWKQTGLKMKEFQNLRYCKIWPETFAKCEKWWLKYKIFSADAAKLGGPPGAFFA